MNLVTLVERLKAARDMLLEEGPIALDRVAEVSRKIADAAEAAAEYLREKGSAKVGATADGDVKEQEAAVELKRLVHDLRHDAVKAVGDPSAVAAFGSLRRVAEHVAGG